MQQTAPNAVSTELDWLSADLSNAPANVQPTQHLDINDVFEKITLCCFEEYPKVSEVKPTEIVKKYTHPFKSKKKKGKNAK